jgi:hypothetical protein
MKKVIIKNLAGVQTHGAEMQDPSAWISECVLHDVWGKKERQVLHKDEPSAEAYDEADVLEEIVIIDIPVVDPVLISEAFPGFAAVMDDAGNIVQEEIPARPAVYSDAIPAVTHKEVKLRAEYTVEIIDISAKVEQEKINAEALAYLASTDWMVIREMDSGLPCPAEVKSARAAARAKIVR